MEITNKTRNTLLSSTATKLLTEKERVIGLIGSIKPKAIVFETRFGIHTFLMKFSIDVVILNENKEIIALKETLKPNRIFMWNPKYKIVIELPERTIHKSKTKLHDVLQYET
jgi:uncharacterized membrane protein (UPF0127 family)